MVCLLCVCVCVSAFLFALVVAGAFLLVLPCACVCWWLCPVAFLVYACAFSCFVCLLCFGVCLFLACFLCVCVRVSALTSDYCFQDCWGWWCWFVVLLVCVCAGVLFVLCPLLLAFLSCIVLMFDGACLVFCGLCLRCVLCILCVCGCLSACLFALVVAGAFLPSGLALYLCFLVVVSLLFCGVCLGLGCLLCVYVCVCLPSCLSGQLLAVYCT